MNANGDTALILAAWKGKYEVAVVLLRYLSSSATAAAVMERRGRKREIQYRDSHVFLKQSSSERVASGANE